MLQQSLYSSDFANQLPAARRFGPGELIFGKELGAGAFGVVYRVRDRKTETEYAAKVLNVAQGELDEEAKRDFASETSLLASLRDPHIVSFIGTGIDEHNHVMLVTEYMGGGGLNRWLYNMQPEHEFAPHIRIRLAQQVASGIAYLHSVNVIHRDLKSENILLDVDGLNARVGDLGLAKVRSSGASYYAEVLGTVLYMVLHPLTNLL